MPSLKIHAIIFHKQKLSLTIPEKGNEHQITSKVHNPLAGSRRQHDDMHSKWKNGDPVIIIKPLLQAMNVKAFLTICITILQRCLPMAPTS